MPAMEVSPKTLREVEFREKMRGYHPEDVDHFLEQVAAGIEVLQDRLRQAVERAQRAEAAASEAGGADDTLRKTLVLAQRTADLAVQEAREQASRILASAEQQAQAMLVEAEDRGRRTLEEAIAECKAELGRLESTRSQAQQDVETLQRWLDEHKAHLQSSLSDAMDAVERAGVLWPAPSTKPIENAGTSSRPQPSEPPPQALAAIGSAMSETSDPETMMWVPEDDERPAAGASNGYEEAARRGAYPPEASEDAYGGDFDDRALDEFFDESGDFEGDRRFGGRLRRRR
jgi:DivIVA domain-containing protein